MLYNTRRTCYACIVYYYTYLQCVCQPFLLRCLLVRHLYGACFFRIFWIYNGFQ